MNREEGSIGLLGLGLAVCAGMVICGGVSVSAAQLARVDVLEAADHASAAAADRLSVDSAYAHGVDDATLDAALVRQAATQSLAATALPPHITGWSIDAVSVRNKEVSVTVTARVKPPVVGSALKVLGEPITVRVISHARGHLVQH